MPTKHQLEQQLEETRADLEAERERHLRTRDREATLSRELKQAREDLDRTRRMADASQIRAMDIEAEAARLRGHLEGMRYMIRLERGLEPHEDPLPPRFESNTGDFTANFARMAGQ
jgi:septal ring factor EnvC (AmiA/AmiB activator)